MLIILVDLKPSHPCVSGQVTEYVSALGKIDVSLEDVREPDGTFGEINGPTPILVKDLKESLHDERVLKADALPSQGQRYGSS